MLCKFVFANFVILIACGFRVECNSLLLPIVKNNVHICNYLANVLELYTWNIRYLKVIYLLEDRYCRFNRAITLHAAYSKPMINDHHISQKIAAYVIFSNRSHLDDILEKLSLSSTFRARGKFFLVCQGQLQQIFRILFKHGVFNVVVIREFPNNPFIESYTYFPFELESIHTMSNNVTLLDAFSNGHFNKSVDIFPDKLPSKWRNTTVKVLLLKILPYVICEPGCRNPGFEVLVFEELRKYMGFTVEYLPDEVWDWGVRMDNGSYTFGLGYLEQKVADLSFGLYHFKPNASSDFDHLREYMVDKLTWAVPRARERPSWIKMVNIFSVAIWCLVVTCLVTTSSVWFLIHTSLLNRGRSWSRLASTLTRILIENPCPTATVEFSCSKIIFVSWWIFSFLIVTAYKACLITFLTYPSFEPQISNVKEMTESGIPFGVYPELAEYYNDPAEGAVGTYIYEHAEDCDVSHDCLDRVAFSGTYMTGTTAKEVAFLTPMYYLAEDGTSRLYVFKDGFQTDFVTTYCRNGLPYFEQLDTAATRLRSAGIVDHMERMTLFRNKIMYTGFAEKSAHVHRRRLGVNELFGPLLLLTASLGVSAVVFVIEIAWGDLHGRSTKIIYPAYN